MACWCSHGRAGAHDRFITSHVTAAHRDPAVAHLRIGRQQDAGSGPCSLRLHSPYESSGTAYNQLCTVVSMLVRADDDMN